MNTTDIVCLTLLVPLLFVRYIYYGHIKLLHSMNTLLLFLSFYFLFFYTYESYLAGKTTEDEVKDISDYTLSDINDVTTIQFNGTELRKSFPKDEEESKHNRKMLRNGLLITLIPLYFLLIVTYRYDPDFLNNIVRNLIGVMIIFAIEFYFSYSIIQEYRGEGYEGIRHEIVDRFLNK